MAEKIPFTLVLITDHCEIHKEQYISYCKSHECACCKKCRLQKHKQCKDIVSLHDVVQNIKDSAYFTEIEMQINELIGNIKCITKDRECNVAKLSEQRQIIEKQIIEIRQSFNEHLDKLHENILSELSDVEASTNRKIQKLLQSLKEKEREVIKMQKDMSNLRKYATELHAFLGSKQIESKALKTDLYLQELIDDGSLLELNIALNTGNIVSNFVTSFKIFGQILVGVDKENIKTLKRRKSREAQIVVSPVSKTSKNTDYAATKLKKKIGPL